MENSAGNNRNQIVDPKNCRKLLKFSLHIKPELCYFLVLISFYFLYFNSMRCIKKQV